MQVLSTSLSLINPSLNRQGKAKSKAQISKELKSGGKSKYSQSKNLDYHATDWIEAEWSEWHEESEEHQRMSPWLAYKKVQNILLEQHARIDFYT